MNKYTATFADGTTVTRSTTNFYGVAWMATWTRDGKQRQRTGFSVSADKVAAFRPHATFTSRYMSSNERAKAKARNAAFLVEVGYRVEIAPTVLTNAP